MNSDLTKSMIYWEIKGEDVQSGLRILKHRLILHSCKPESKIEKQIVFQNMGVNTRKKQLKVSKMVALRAEHKRKNYTKMKQGMVFFIISPIVQFS